MSFNQCVLSLHVFEFNYYQGSLDKHQHNLTSWPRWNLHRHHSKLMLWSCRSHSGSAAVFLVSSRTRIDLMCMNDMYHPAATMAVLCIRRKALTHTLHLPRPRCVKWLITSRQINWLYSPTPTRDNKGHSRQTIAWKQHSAHQVQAQVHLRRGWGGKRVARPRQEFCLWVMSDKVLTVRRLH